MKTINIRFKLTGMGLSDTPIPKDIQLPIPMTKGELFSFIDSSGNRRLEVYDTYWEYDNNSDQFSQVVLLGIRLPRKEDYDF